MRGHKWHPCSYLQLHSISSGGPFSRWYHSAGALKGKRQSRRDDLQSLAYCLVLFHVGKSFIDWKEDLKDPASADVAEHYRDRLPIWLHKFVTYCVDLEWSEQPAYGYLRQLIRSRLTSEAAENAADFCKYATRRHLKRSGC
mmetsp:Transcript_25594/g.40652  ORF Transcript_25594/g.40652 Transcript_25594/m.40652 type:complete len:142 (+) Transcript_25594:180-605(+)